MTRVAILTPSQLTDVLNFVLGLPRLNGRAVVRQPISPVVVASWPLKPTRLSAESWADAKLRECGILPKTAVSVGRRLGASMPREIIPWT